MLCRPPLRCRRCSTLISSCSNRFIRLILGLDHAHESCHGICVRFFKLRVRSLLPAVRWHLARAPFAARRPFLADVRRRTSPLPRNQKRRLSNVPLPQRKRFTDHCVSLHGLDRTAATLGPSIALVPSLVLVLPGALATPALHDRPQRDCVRPDEARLPRHLQRSVWCVAVMFVWRSLPSPSDINRVRHALRRTCESFCRTSPAGVRPGPRSFSGIRSSLRNCSSLEGSQAHRGPRFGFGTRRKLSLSNLKPSCSLRRFVRATQSPENGFVVSCRTRVESAAPAPTSNSPPITRPLAPSLNARRYTRSTASTTLRYSSSSRSAPALRCSTACRPS